LLTTNTKDIDMTECNGLPLRFSRLGRRKIQADFNGGQLTSDAGAALLREVDQRIGVIEKADVPRFRFHDIRHTFASLLLQQGESLHYVKEQMGHASIQTTVDVYGHLVPGSNRNAVNRLDDPSLRLARPSAG